MQAFIKKDNKIIVNGADKAESILLENIVDMANTESAEVVFTKIYDINGDITGVSIEVNETTA